MTILCGDCRDLIKTLKHASIDLVYLDPPFFTQKTHSLMTRDNTEKFAFEDRWLSLNEYITFMQDVLTECRNVLKESGSVFLHCDRSASHHLRILLDNIFGAENFQSEIIWSYKRWSNAKKGLLNSHQTIYFYSKSSVFKFNTLFTDYSPTTNIDQILQARARNDKGKSAYRRDENGNIVLGGEKKGVPLSDVWNIPFLNPKAKERVGYPTQKPVLLLERIIEISTDTGDCVLDPFCGSGTTLIAAKLLGRTYIGIDILPEAVELTQKRLQEPIKSISQVLISGEDSFLDKTDYERGILRAIGAIPVERNSGIDGILKVYVNNLPVSVRIQKQGESIEIAKRKLIAASKTKNCELMILIHTQKDAERSFFDNWNDENILVIDTYDLEISDWVYKNHDTVIANAMADENGDYDTG
jgi:site-specific DNA-methyltransferase (adenine-specific)